MTTAYFTIEGSAIICFNPDKQRGEIAILRQGDHQLKIAVFRNDNEDEPIKVYDHQEIPGNAVIEIKTVEPVHQGYNQLAAGNFGRLRGLNGNDERDLQWILDLEGDELHGKQMIPQPSLKAGLSLTKMFVPNAVFYSANLTKTKECWLKRIDDTTVNPDRLGMVADSLGAAVRAKTVTLEVTGFEPLILDDGANYQIIVANMEDYEPSISDFHNYYDVLKPDDDIRFDLFPVESKSKTVLNGTLYECFCVRCSRTRTIDNFPV